MNPLLRHERDRRRQERRERQGRPEHRARRTAEPDATQARGGFSGTAVLRTGMFAATSGASPLGAGEAITPWCSCPRATALQHAVHRPH